MKIIVAGGGKVGSTLIRELTADKHDLTLIDMDEQVLASCGEQNDILVLSGNCASMAVLKTAGIENSDLLIAVTDADEVNLLCCATAKTLNPQIHTIARIRNPEYTDQIFQMKDIFGLSLIVNPERAAAEEIERLIRYPGFLKRESFARGLVELVELSVEKKGLLDGLALKQFSSAVKSHVLVCAVLRNNKVIMPGGSFVLAEGDRIFVTAPSFNIITLLRNLGIVSTRSRQVVLCGGSTVCFYLAQKLQKLGINVSILEQDRERCLQLAKDLPDCNIFNSDISDPTVLDKEGLQNADALVTLTGMDETNILISLYAKSQGVRQVITKQDHSDQLRTIIQNLSPGSIISPKALCCSRIIRYIRSLHDLSGNTAKTVEYLADGLAVASEFVLTEDSLHQNEPLKDLHFKKGVLIAAIARGNDIRIPDGSSSFCAGDSVIVISGAEVSVCSFNDVFV